MKIRNAPRGLSPAGIALLVAVLSLLALTLGWWVWTRFLARPSAFALAAHLPASSQGVLLLSVPGQLDGSAFQGVGQEFWESLPPDEQQRLVHRLEEALGAPWSDWSQVWDGRLAMAVLPRDTVSDRVALVGLRGPAPVEKLKASPAWQGAKETAVGEVKFHVLPSGRGWGVDQRWLYLADSPSAAEALVAAAHGQGERLLSRPEFEEAEEALGASSALLVGFWDLGASWPRWQKAPWPYTDAQTFEGLRCLRFAALKLDGREGRSQAFLRVESDNSSLAQKLLTPGSVSAASLKGLSSQAGSGYALDLEWTFHTLVAALMLSPDTREAAGMAAAGLAIVGNPFHSFGGEVVWATDAWEQFAPTIATNFQQARGKGQLSACRANLRNLATALEMYSTEHQGAYPAQLSELAPQFLAEIPHCPSAGQDTYTPGYQRSEKPSSFRVACQGEWHQQAQPNLPAYSSTEGLLAGEMPPDPEPKSEPQLSLAAIAPVKDVALAHALVDKAFGGAAGPEPAAGEDKTYPLPGAQLVLRSAEPAQLRLALGPKGGKLIQTEDGDLMEGGRWKELLDWGGEGIVYADTLDLRPTLEVIAQSSAGLEPSARAWLEGLAQKELGGASCLTVRPDGLHWRGQGVSGGALLLFAGAGALFLLPPGGELAD